MQSLSLCLTAILVTLAIGTGAQTPNRITVSDFKRGLTGWSTNDTERAAGKASATTLVTIADTERAHSGNHALAIRYAKGSGFASAALDLTTQSKEWATDQVDEIRMWLRGDGSDNQVRIDLQTWADDLRSTLFFQIPVSLKETGWHEVVLPLKQFQQSDPTHPLRIPSLIALQFDMVGDIKPAELAVDDIVALNAHGEGAPFAVGPFDKIVAALPPAKELPRLGNWAYPGRNEAIMKKCLALGIGFCSGWDTPIVQQKMFINGIVTNLSPGRPTVEELTAGLGLAAEDMDQDSQGRPAGEGIQGSIFLPAVVERFYDYVYERVKSRANDPWVSSVMLSSPVSMYGEVHYPASTGGQYIVFSRPAKANYRKWLAAQYGNSLPNLSKAWGRKTASWDEIVPPMGPTAGSGGIDERTEWSDFMHWYNDWLEEVTRKSIQAARSATKKPIAVMMGGPKIGLSQGIALGNIGPIVRMLGRVKPTFFSDTDGQTLFSARYSRAACSQYGVEQMLEHVGPPGLQVFHQYNMVLNILACGTDHAHLATLGELFDDNHWFSGVWKHLAPVVLRYRTHYRKSDAAMFHSYVTSWYRPDRSNGDCVSLYDSTNTLWFPDKGYPSWGRVLGSPDIVDDAMIEDDGLLGRKLLVIPNISTTITTRKAVDALKAWVSNGGTLVGFGEGCLAYMVERNRSLTQTPGMAGLLPLEAVRKAVASGTFKPIEGRLGKGRVVLYPYPADPDKVGVDGLTPARRAMAGLKAEVKRAGIRILCHSDAGEDVNIMYAGRDSLSGRHLFTLDLTRYVRNGLPDAIFQTDRTIRFTFDPSLVGESELVAVTDSFSSCDGGRAAFDADAHILTVRFTLPGRLTLRFGRGKGGLELARNPLLLWQNEYLLLRGTDGYGVAQSQEPLVVGGDGSLTPSDVKMLYLIHGDMHRPKFGRGPTFRIELKKPGAVVTHINSVTTAGATLVITVDGKEAVRRNLPDRDGRGDPFNNEYNEDVVVNLEAGDHTVHIDNEGGDWVSVDRYVFKGLR